MKREALSKSFSTSMTGTFHLAPNPLRGFWIDSVCRHSVSSSKTTRLVRGSQAGKEAKKKLLLKKLEGLSAESDVMRNLMSRAPTCPGDLQIDPALSEKLPMVIVFNDDKALSAVALNRASEAGCVTNFELSVLEHSQRVWSSHAAEQIRKLIEQSTARRAREE